MSLIRICRRTGLRHSARALVPRAYLATESPPVVPDSETKEPSEIANPPNLSRDVTVADVISGAPVQLRHRPVRIYAPTRSTTQSGSSKSDRWRIDFDILQGGGRWENPLMGWASSADYMQGTRISFRSKEDAIHFAEKQGWDYYVQIPMIKKIPPKNYAENYVYKPNRLRIARTK